MGRIVLDEREHLRHAILWLVRIVVDTPVWFTEIPRGSRHCTV
jgi:hypothetical protein